MSRTVVLVYSGGLDTTVCIPLLREEYGFEHVVTVTVDVGQPREDIADAAERAKILGTEHYTVDAKAMFVEHFCWPAVRAKNGHPAPYGVRFFQIGNETYEFSEKAMVSAGLGLSYPEGVADWYVQCLAAYIDRMREVALGE